MSGGLEEKLIAALFSTAVTQPPQTKMLLALRLPARSIKSFKSVRLQSTLQYKLQPQLVSSTLPCRLPNVLQLTNQYVHDQAGKYLISFSKNPESIPLGLIRNRASLERAGSEKVQNADFTENKEFMALLQKIVKENVHDDFAYVIEAGAAPASYVPIYDFRAPPSYGRATDAEDALGYIRSDDAGVMTPLSYELNYSYRPLSDQHGFIKLSDHLHEKLLEVLEN